MSLLLALSFVACKKNGEKKADTSQKVEKSKKSSDSLKETPSSDFRYTMTDDGAGVKITAYIGTSPKIIIPAEIEGLPVLEVEALAECDHEEDAYWNDIFDKWVQESDGPPSDTPQSPMNEAHGARTNCLYPYAK